MRNKMWVMALAIATMVAACGSSAEPTTTAAPAEAVPTASEVALAETALGRVLVDGAGLTMYLFTDDVDGESTCYDACATAWPPVAATDALAEDLDPAVFGSVTRLDGTSQLTAGGHPLYLFSGDTAPGDVNGQGSGDVWFAVDATGAAVGGDGAVEEAPAEDPVAEEEPAQDPATEVLTDADGYTLYVFANDTDGFSNCNDPCSETWPPVAADEQIAMDTLRLDVVARADGSSQLAIEGQPLYTYAGDEAPGDVNGQEVGGVWFAVGADGEVIRPGGLRIGSTDIGDVVIDADGFTLYTFDKDTEGASSCNDPCSATWPPVPGETRIDASALDPAQFGTITREDGTSQLTLGGRPLYRYVGDAFPGDANGIAIGGGVWKGVAADAVASATDPNGGVVSVSGGEGADAGTGAAGVAITETTLGPALVDAAGRTLYGFLNDTPDSSACDDACAAAWPPVSGDTALPPDVDPDLFSVIDRPDGTTQLVIGNWPLYRFAGDAGPGDINGQGSGDVWFVIAPDGSLYR